MNIRIAGVTLLLALGSACGTSGALGNFTFYDTTLSADGLPVPGPIARAVAVGADLTLEVRDGSENGPGALTTEILSGDAFTVAGSGTRVTVHAASEGTATIEVSANDGTKDQIDLTAKPLATVELYPWADTIVSYGEPDGTVFALAAHGRVGLNGKLLDANGERLTGEGLLTFGADTAAITAEPFQTYANGAYLTWDGSGPGDVLLTGGRDSSFPVRLLAPGAELTLTIALDSTHTEDGDVVTAEGPTLIGALRMYDDGGRRVMVAQDATPVWTVVEGPATLIRDVGDDVFGADTGTFLLAVCPGTGTIGVTLAGVSAEVAFVITGTAVDGCTTP